jgi:hypothetical protein
LTGRSDWHIFEGKCGRRHGFIVIVIVFTDRLLTSRPQVWINQGDIVLLSLRDFQDDKADVIVKYTADEARNCMCHDYPY